MIRIVPLFQLQYWIRRERDDSVWSASGFS
jgi:hypothetical protein